MKNKPGKLEVSVPPADSGSSLPALSSPPQTPSAGSAGEPTGSKADDWGATEWRRESEYFERLWAGSVRLAEELTGRAEKAEAEVERLRAALQKIIDGHGDCGQTNCHVCHIRRIARAALEPKP